MTLEVWLYIVLGALWIVSARACAYGGWLTRRSLLVLLAAGVLAVLCGVLGPYPGSLLLSGYVFSHPDNTFSEIPAGLAWYAPFCVFFTLFHLIIRMALRLSPRAWPCPHLEWLALTGFGLPLPFLLINTLFFLYFLVLLCFGS